VRRPDGAGRPWRTGSHAGDGLIAGAVHRSCPVPGRPGRMADNPR
jgi:hypothetical protein